MQYRESGKDSKRYYWVKLDYRRFENGGDLDFLMSQKNGSAYIVLYMMLCLQTRNTDGEMVSIFGDMAIPYDVDKIVRDCKYFSRDTVMIALELYKKLGLIYELDNGVMKIANYENIVGSETKDAARMRLKRSQKVEQIEEHSENNQRTEFEQLENIERTMFEQCSENVRQEKREKSKDNRGGEEKRENIILSKKEEPAKKLTINPLVASFLKKRGLWSEKLEFSIQAWLEMRKSIRKPATDRAIELSIDKAVEIAEKDGCSIADVFDQSTMNSWQGLFHLKEENSTTKTGRNMKNNCAMGRDIDRFDGENTEVFKL